jgi:protein-S-isoprenylcysteine O-methyltransferase Ste14
MHCSLYQDKGGVKKLYEITHLIGMTWKGFDKVYRYIICAIICAAIWIVNGIWITQAVRERITSEIYFHVGLGIYFTLLTLELSLGVFELWTRLDILWLQVVGFILYIPAAYLVVASMHALRSKGTPESEFSTTTFVDTGVYSIVRQPMTLGTAIWSLALILVFQSSLAVILGVLAIFCCWMSARAESEYDVKKFGDAYKEYMKKIPMWNIFKGLGK